jgi:RimJ/RimL family protein N-acetyltransferase/SAM-dependent methyltransferase
MSLPLPNSFAAHASWDATWSQAGAQAWYPDEQVVRFLARNYVQRRAPGPDGLIRVDGGVGPLRALILGCGKGRHVVLAAEHAIEAHGVDISAVAVEGVNAWLSDRGLEATVSVGPVSHIEYPDRYFDMVVCHGVLDHVLEADRAAAIQESYRVLKPGGRFFVSLISEEDSARGEGVLIEPDTWVIEEGYEAGIPQAFFTPERIATALARFEVESMVAVRNLALMGRSLIGTDKQYPCDSRFYITARRPRDDALVAQGTAELTLSVTESAELRILKEEDATQQYVAGMNDPDVTRFLVGAKQNPPDITTIRRYIRDNRDDPRSLFFGFFLDGNLRGTMRIHDIDTESGSAYVGIAIFDKTVWGRGWSGKLLLRMRDFLARNLGLVTLIAGIDTKNVGAIRAFQHAGFRHDPARNVSYLYGEAQFQIWNAPERATAAERKKSV